MPFHIRYFALLQSRSVHLVTIMVLCVAAVLPFLYWGIPSGHDFEIHMYSWMDALGQWREGIIYPRWAPSAHWGYGEPRFLFYPPVSWMLGAALGSVLPWKIVPGVYCWLALALAGAGMYRLAERWLRPSDALFAAIFYALNPYHLLVIYWRSAYAELLGAGLLPLLVLAVAKLADENLRPVPWLSLILAASWLVNVPVAVMLHYSAAGLALFIAVREKSARPLVRLGAAVLLGAGLAAIYLLPAIYEQRWVHIGEVLSPGVRPQDNFLFTKNMDPDHDHFNLLVSLVGATEMVVLAYAIWASRKKRTGNNVWMAAALWGVASALAMFRFSNFLWEHLPEFRFTQLPFRWLLCVNVPTAFLLAMAGGGRGKWRWMVRGFVSIVLLATLVVGGWRTQLPWWVTADDIKQMRQSVADGRGNEGVDEYVPVAADPYQLNKNLPRVSDGTGARIEGEDDAGLGASEPAASETSPSKSADTNLLNVQIERWAATDKKFRVLAKGRWKVLLRLFNYPAWEAMVNGQPVAIETTEETGLMVIPVQAGESEVEIRFTRTVDQWAGTGISVFSVMVLAFGWSWTRTASGGNA